MFIRITALWERRD